MTGDGWGGITSKSNDMQHRRICRIRIRRIRKTTKREGTNHAQDNISELMEMLWVLRAAKMVAKISRRCLRILPTQRLMKKSMTIYYHPPPSPIGPHLDLLHGEEGAVESGDAAPRHPREGVRPRRRDEHPAGNARRVRGEASGERERRAGTMDPRTPDLGLPRFNFMIPVSYRW